jgi:AcrR family transcriptional regulator
VAEQARTRLARRAVVDAARELFLERGYAATTVEAISERADVPPATLYRLFASKLGVLRQLLDVSIAGDDQPVALPDRPEVAPVFAAADPVEVLRGAAGITTAINQRTNDVYGVLVGAAGSAPRRHPRAAEPGTTPGRARAATHGRAARRRQDA